jgi:hypothetical protein
MGVLSALASPQSLLKPHAHVELELPDRVHERCARTVGTPHTGGSGNTRQQLTRELTPVAARSSSSLGTTRTFTQREAGKKETPSRKQQNGASVKAPPPLADSKRQSKAAESRVSKRSTHAASQKDKKKPRPTAHHVDAIEQTPEFVEVTNHTPVHQLHNFWWCRTTRMCHTFAAHA